MPNVLEGIKVIEVASMAAAPSATVILADLGAEVIKIEPPSNPPYTTYIQNRTKKSVALNFKAPEAQEALRKLAVTADVFLTNSPRNPYPCKLVVIE